MSSDVHQTATATESLVDLRVRSVHSASQDPVKTAEFWEKLRLEVVHWNQIVSVDETGTNRRDFARTHGRARRGER